MPSIRHNGNMNVPEKIENTHGERLAFSFAPGADDARELVVIGHGVTSDKDRPWSEALSAALQVAGIASLRIAFSGNGQSDGHFEEATITKEVADLGCVVDSLESWRVSSELRSDLMSLGSIVGQAPTIRVPWLIVHGSDDAVVPLQHSLDLAAAAGETGELMTIDGADHSFTGDYLEPMITAVVSWLDRRRR